MKVGFVSLGCSKNLVDTEMLIGLFKKNCNEIVNEPKDAEIIVINTCGFIESAKQEAINTILEMAEYKEKGTCKYLVVMGCLVQRYKKELQKALPEVDLFIEINDYTNYWDKILELLDEKEKPDTINNLCYMDRVISTGNKTAYLKIAEGCSNRCTYCAIPYIRGPYVSRPMEEVLEEAKNKYVDAKNTLISEGGKVKSEYENFLKTSEESIEKTKQTAKELGENTVENAKKTTESAVNETTNNINKTIEKVDSKVNETKTETTKAVETVKKTQTDLQKTKDDLDKTKKDLKSIF